MLVNLMVLDEAGDDVGTGQKGSQCLMEELGCTLRCNCCVLNGSDVVRFLFLINISNSLCIEMDLEGT